MKPRPEQIEVVDDNTLAALRSKSPAEQIAIGFEMWEFARTLILNALRSEHPDWSDERILEETARRMSA